MVINKSPEAFRTISEAAVMLSLPAHVLRFWESKFTQIKPIKRAGGRRFYRPNDIFFLIGIKKLLHTDGMTINGVKRLIRENGTKHIITIGKDNKTKGNNGFPNVKKPLDNLNKSRTEIDNRKISQILSQLILIKSNIEKRILNAKEAVDSSIYNNGL